VELANEFYADRLEREKIETKLEVEKNEKVYNPTNPERVHNYLESLEKFNPEEETSKYLNIRKNRGADLLSVRTIPATDQPTSVVKAKLQASKRLRFGWKTLFDDDGVVIGSGDGSIDDTSNNREGTAEELAGGGSKGKKEQLVSKKDSSKESKLPQFTPGKRMGFGTLLLDSQKFPENYEEPIKPYITHSINPDGESDYEKDEEIREKLENIYDDDQDEMLRKEKSRTASLLAEFMAKAKETTSPPPVTKQPKDKIRKKEDAATSSSANENSNNNNINTIQLGKNGDSPYVNVSKLTDIFHKDGGMFLVCTSYFVLLTTN